MSDQCIIKICLKSDYDVQKELEKLLSFVQNVDKIYYNFYRQEYRSSQRYEDTTWMGIYTEQTAKSLLKKRLRGTFPFFLDVYGTQAGTIREAFTLARIGKTMFLYLILCKENFIIRREAIFLMVEYLIAENVMLIGYCSDLADFWWNEQAGVLESSAWRQRRRRIYAFYNTVDYSLEDEKRLFWGDEVLYPASWTSWCNRNFLCESKERLLEKHRHLFYAKTEIENGIMLQLYKEIDGYKERENRLKSQNFYAYLKNNKIFTCRFGKLC